MKHQNKTIERILNIKDKYTGENKLHNYNSHGMNLEILYTNIILRKIIRDDYFEWCDPKTFAHSFGKPQYYNNNNIDRFSFSKLPVSESRVFNRIPTGIFPYRNIGITNVWMVINRPNDVRLDDIFSHIIISYGNSIIHTYRNESIESQINTMAHILGVDGIFYRNNKIFVPILCLHNGFFLNDVHDDAIIETLSHDNFFCKTAESSLCPEFYDTSETIDFEIWGNVCDMDSFHNLIGKTNRDKDFNTVFYQIMSNGKSDVGVSSCLIKISPSRPTYAIYISNIVESRVKSIQLFLCGFNMISGTPVEYKLYDIEWFESGAIIWFNRKFLSPGETSETFNFSYEGSSWILINHTYHYDKVIETNCIVFKAIRHSEGMSEILYNDK